MDHIHSCSEVADDRACDSQNLIGNVIGEAGKRGGSERLIKQAFSSNPTNGLHWTELNMGTYTKSALFAATWDKILISTIGDNPLWRVLVGSMAAPNQNFSFADAFGGQVVMTGDALTDPIYKYDMILDTVTRLFSVDSTSTSMNYRAKRVLAVGGYLTLGAVMDVRDKLINNLTGATTYYPSRLAYSMFEKISSFTASRYIDINSGDGEELTGLTEKGGTTKRAIMAYKPTSVNAIVFSVLNHDADGGDITVNNVASGFGCVSPLALVNIGPFDIVPARDGFYLYDGARRARLTTADELQPISKLVDTDYRRTIKRRTFDKSVGHYHAKESWYVWSFNDPFFKPEGIQNRVFILDLKTFEWWPQKNWLASSFTDVNDVLFYGDSSDGYVHKANIDTEIDDSRKELFVDSLDKSVGWQPEPTIDSATYVESTASLKMSAILNNSWVSSMTKMGLINFGEFPDGSEVSRDRDLLSFKFKISSLAVLTNLIVDLQYGVTQQAFNNLSSSVTLSSAAFFSIGVQTTTSFTSNWAEITIALSSFILPPPWNDLATQEAPFSRALTVYGIRFRVNAVASTTVNLDDLRVVQGTKNQNEVFYLTKQFNFNTPADKDVRQVVLSRVKPADSSFNIDVFTDYGQFANRIVVSPEIPKEVFVCGYKGTNGFARLKSTDFSFLDSTSMPNANIYDYMNGVATRNRIVVFDKVLNRFMLLDRNNYNSIISSFGSLGASATSYDMVNQMALAGVSGDRLLLTDTLNNRIGELSIFNDQLLFVRSFGQLGTGATSFMSPSGITGDSANAWVIDDGNFRIVKLSVSTFGYVSERRIDSNTIGEGVMRNDGDYLYLAYHKVASTPYLQDVVLEKRTKGDMTLIQRKILRPRGVIDQSTYTLSGDFDLIGPYLFIGFTKDLATTGTYYVQKLLKDGFDLVDEYQTASTQFSVLGDGLAWLPETKQEKINLGAPDAVYIQLKYYDSSLENTFHLKNYSFAKQDKPYTE